MTINGASAHMIGSFVRLGDGRIGAARGELSELGLDPSAAASSADFVLLDDFPGASYRYDEPKQAIAITIDNGFRKVNAFDFAQGANLRRAVAAWGAVVNYDVLAGGATKDEDLLPQYSGSSLTLDSRAFSPYGVFSQGVIARTDPNNSNAVRLETAYRYRDQDNLVSYRAGDAVSGGLPWTRPIRWAGFLAERDFGLRPDLITAPLPTLGGTAAVPATVDIYLNNVRSFSQDVDAGPFSFANVPLITGAGNARVVVRDAAGHETATTLDYYATPSLLAPGLTSFSVGAGLPRLDYGGTDDRYSHSPVASATARRGVTDWLTVEGHGEGGAGLINAGAGAVFRTGAFGAASLALTASARSGDVGAQVYGSYEAAFAGFSLNVSAQHALGDYRDLASVTARETLDDNEIARLYNDPAILLLSTNPPRALDRLTIGAPLPFIDADFSVSFIHINDDVNETQNVVSGSISYALPDNASLFATAFAELGDDGNAGIFVGVSWPLGADVSLSSSVSYDKHGASAEVGAIKPLDNNIGSYGWRVRDAEGESANREAKVAYRAEKFRVEGSVGQDHSGGRGYVEVDGAVAMLGGGMFFTNRIDDAFAVVDVGAPGVEVFNENRPVGFTDEQGLLLVRDLRSYQPNKLTIDGVNLPVDAEIEKSHDVIAPADRAGVIVKFEVRQNTEAALVVFRRPDGEFVPAGATGKIDGGEDFVVGYDGEAFIHALGADNAVTITTIDGDCQSRFAFAPRPGEQVRVAAVCQ